MIKKLNSVPYIPFQIKMVFSVLLIVVLPISILFPVLQIYQEKAIEAEIEYIHQERSAQTSAQLEMVYEQINSVSNLYFLDSDIEKILRTGHIYDYPQLEIDKQKVIYLQQRYNATVPKVDLHVTIISNDNRIYGDGTYDSKVPLTGIQDLWWYQELLESPWQTLWIADDYLDRLHGISNPHYIYSVRLLKRFDTWENHGILIMSFLESDLVKLYANTVPAGGSVFITNRDQSLISKVDNANVYASGLLNRLPSGYTTSYREKIGGIDYQIVTNTVRLPMWKIVTVTPEWQLRDQYQELSLLVPTMTLLFMIVLGFFSFFISHQIVRPIGILTKGIQKIGKSGDLSQKIEIHSRDEIGYLASEFNNMLSRIDQLMESMMKEQSAKRSAELQALYAQINPHFIYNTLTSIRFLVISGDNQRADSALYDFIILLRNAISNNEELCTIQEELDFLTKYINIQQLFFDKPFQVVWDIAPEIRLCRIVKLTLQPVVENAILHGLKSKEGYKKLSIRIAPAGSNILITISDNGIGTNKTFDFEHTACDSSKSIGLANIHRRIVLHFGAPYGVYVSSVVGEGTTVKLLVPRIESRKEIM